ncbi:MAG: YceD family protein [Chloroflexota bacterium]
MISFNVAQLLKSPTGTVRKVEVDEVDEDLRKDLRLVSATKGTLRLMRTTAGILVTGKLRHKVEATCSRCLETYIRDQVIELNDEFVPVVDVNSGLPAPEPADADAFRITPNHLLDLTEAIRQYAILEAPFSPLCDENCRGLCSNCGANLNTGPCGCQPAAEEEETPKSAFGSLLEERMREAGFEPKEE